MRSISNIVNNMNPRTPWLVLYIFVNIYAAFFIFNTKELMGDVSYVTLYSDNALLYATAIVVLSYLFISVFVFNFIVKIKVKAINFGHKSTGIGKQIGILLIFLQIAFMAFNFLTGVNVGGSRLTRTTDSPLAMIWVLIPVDILFVIYYGMYRESKYFYPNLIVFVISQVSRGWVGNFMVIIFFEWCRLVRRRKIKAIPLLFAGLIILILYPLLTSLKWAIRASAANVVSATGILERMSDFLKAADFFSIVSSGINHLIGRLQLTSMMVEVIRLRDTLQTGFENGDFYPFWMEGLHGIFFDKLFHGEKIMNIGVAFTMYEDFWGKVFDVGSYNVSLGYASWFFITPYLAPFYVIYTLLLGFVSYFLVKKIGISELSEDMLWFYWLGLLLAGWLAVFVTFIYALLLFLIIKIIFSWLPTFRFWPNATH